MRIFEYENYFLSEYKTKTNQNITFKLEKDIEGNKNRGWIVHKITAFVNGEEAGYIKVMYIPKERFKEYYPNVINYISQITGYHPLPSKKEHLPWQKLSTEELRKLVQSTYFIFLRKDFSTDEIKKLSRKKLEEMTKYIISILEDRYNKKFEEFKNYEVDKPKIDYIYVDKKFRRRRIGLMLYLKMAKWLKKQGLKLYASNLQSDDAKAIWNYLEKNYNVKKDGDRRYLDI